MHYNGKAKRDQLLAEMERRGVFPFDEKRNRFVSFINLCIHPYDWATCYHQVRNRKQISSQTWEAFNGAIFATFVIMNKSTGDTKLMLADVALDYIDFIRADKVGDPWKFLMSMRRYFPRYSIIKGLASFGLDWREFAYSHLGARCKPTSRSHHTIFTNVYVRTLVKAVVVFKQYRGPEHDDYQPGVNDMHSLLLTHSNSTKCLPYDRLEVAVNELLSLLPTWSPSIRARVNYMLSYMQPAHYILEKQMLPSTERKVLGSGAKD